MTTNAAPFAMLSDQDLLAEVKTLACDERHATAHLIASLAELDARRLFLGEGCSSLFAYCTQVLHLSEHAAYGRIAAARASRRFPVILDLLADGAIHLTTVGLLAPHLTVENHLAMLAGARHKGKRAVEEIVARLRPALDVPSTIRKLPHHVITTTSAVAATPAQVQVRGDSVREVVPVLPVSSAPKRAAVVAPLAPERYKVLFTVSRETHDKLRRAQDLLRHTIPNGDLGVIFDRALTLLVADLEKTKLAATVRPRAGRQAASGSRHVPAAVRREVWTRDGGRCAFVGTNGRCSEQGFLEFHHVVPFAEGGATAADNLQLRCRAHNAYESERWFGQEQPWLLKEARAVWIHFSTRSGPSRGTRCVRAPPISDS
jgi:5-methylcytosine-specific restriction endonuclease McrA